MGHRGCLTYVRHVQLRRDYYSTARKICNFIRQESEDLIFDPRLALDGCILSFKSNISHLVVSMDSFLQPRHMVEARIRQFFGAVNAVLGQIGGVGRSDKVWLQIVDMKLFPVLAFGTHLWD